MAWYLIPAPKYCLTRNQKLATTIKCFILTQPDFIILVNRFNPIFVISFLISCVSIYKVFEISIMYNISCYIENNIQTQQAYTCIHYTHTVCKYTCIYACDNKQKISWCWIHIIHVSNVLYIHRLLSSMWQSTNKYMSLLIVWSSCVINTCNY